MKPIPISELPTFEELSKYFSYDAESGIVTNRIGRGMVVRGAVSGSVGNNGYLVTGFNYQRFLTHRLAWILHYGEWPKDEIDHINHNVSDNRIDNLRVVTRSEQNRNATLSKNNKSGAVGVSFNNKSRKWIASIGDQGTSVHVGSFPSFQLAKEAREAANVQYGYHSNHGSVTC